MKLKKDFDRHYQKFADYKKLSWSRSEYEKYQKLFWRDEIWCKEIISYLQYMDYVRDLHISLLETSNIIKDFENISSQKLYGSPIKLDILNDAVVKLASYDKAFWISFSIQNKQIIDKETGPKKEIIDLLTILMQRTIWKTIMDLHTKNLISNADIEQFQNKITLEYVNSCSNFHGSYKMKEIFTANRILISQQVDEMKILLNVCYNYHILYDIWFLFEKIVLHEFGHHIYYQKDKHHADFEAICWTDDKTKKRTCWKQAFVTKYATTNALEDYAEQFMYSYLRIRSYSNPFLDKKDNYFLHIFPLLKTKITLKN